ncbi:MULTISPECIES: 50S ribosomal protein L11 methyltransferase [Reichenbachiella]|uniref:Ribosomal protein L11 methyltransferase n=1 Tax=Reichenbachiella agariperforans TaxID=156994 RepID=A0A1M6P1T3_REIAG|nr:MULTISPECIES: 50S ribosomal protein L11 methyltransferase [Reichenbachiella]MBU2914707.1 50S ribosomal protein L11 methyltransferase [Reichenbachiella agariperforans]RJE71627.1 ribosomal protein L11 methyltransferase [Reichenbachiella sp. MSK19-1]SHK01860.1 ribosomal protein L11 methyltransferase [Reichenbachiella agariperforans]
MTFIQLSIACAPEYNEVFIAELAEIGFDTFEENETTVDAYIASELFQELAVREIIQRYKTLAPAKYSYQEIEKQNWNEEWEKNYHPIEVEGKCRVRAVFHEPKPEFEHEIVIIPKMSFGTGHHATTYNMLTLEMENDFKGKSVIDIGTGTGVLAIMADKLGASYIEATDIDDWCIENSTENFGLNEMSDIAVHQGVIDEIKLNRTTYDVVLANINKNVLLVEIPSYAKLLEAKGTLYLSGFYEADIMDIQNKAAEYNLSLDKSVVKDNWAALKLTKY